MTTILDGKKLSNKILADLKQKLDTYKTKPKLTVILVGEDPASMIYVNNKKITAEKLGIKSEVIHLSQETSEDELLKIIDKLNKDSDVTAILVQLPLPKHIDKTKVINAISPLKDVDGFTVENYGKLFSGQKPTVYPCTPKGIIRILDEYNIEVEGKHVVVVGRSNIVGKPVAQMMLNRNATVTICHSRSKNIEQIIKTADIVISAVGKKIIKGEMLKPDSVLIDVGIRRDEDGKTRGDADFDSVSKVASYVTPVPGGVGPMTIASLMMNTVELFELNR